MVSQLNYDLYRFGIRSDAICQCGDPCENSFHYLFECPLYKIQRNIMLVNLRSLVGYHVPVDVQLLLHGNTDLTLSENRDLFKFVQMYINQTKRFM